MTKQMMIHSVKYKESTNEYFYKTFDGSVWITATKEESLLIHGIDFSQGWTESNSSDHGVVILEKNDWLPTEIDQVKIKAAHEILNDCIKVQQERGKDYDTQGGQQERSFSSVATAFNAITGKSITPAEVCLVLQIVKDVRQWSQDRLHEDSVLDGVSYASLKGEELYKQYKGDL